MMDKIPMPVSAETVVLADGEYPSGGLAAALLAGAERVVCCDGAAREFVLRGGEPFAIVGDCDSLDPSLLARFAGIVHRNPDQETNDLTKAVTFCLSRGLRDITILGATGRREDHTLGNISLLVDYARMGMNVRMVSSYGVFDVILGEEMAAEEQSGEQPAEWPRAGGMCMGGSPHAVAASRAVSQTKPQKATCGGLHGKLTHFESFAGQQVSIFTLAPDTLITTIGLDYPLAAAPLTGWWQGTLNSSAGPEFGIVTTGPTIIYRLLKE